MKVREDQRPRVLQVLPADGWRVAFADGDGDVMVDPLICWALIEVQDEEYGPREGDIYWPMVRGCRQALVGIMTGVDGMTDTPEGMENFLGYLPAGAPPSDFAERAQDYAERRRKQRESKS